LFDIHVVAEIYDVKERGEVVEAVLPTSDDSEEDIDL
jgi:hypothetical protein